MVRLHIHVAARDGDLATLRRELADRVTPNARDSEGLQPLHFL